MAPLSLRRTSGGASFLSFWLVIRARSCPPSETWKVRVEDEKDHNER